MQAENANFAGISVSGEQIRQVLSSAEGRQLIALLQKNGGAELQKAVQAARSGDSATAKQAMESLLAGKDAASLLAKMQHG